MMSKLLVIVGALIMLTQPNDPDFGWHYKYGEYIVKNGAILRENIFSYTLQEYKWANSYWLSQVELYILHNAFGTFGPSIINGLILTTILVFIFKKHSLVNKSLFVIIASVLLGTFGVTVRPLYFSTVLMLILLLLLLGKQQKPYLVILSIFLLWSNFHADFMLGLFVYGIYIVFNLKSFKLSRIKLPLLMLMGAVLITLVNPFGIGLWETLANEIINYSKQQINIQEHQSIITHGMQSIILVALATLATISAIKLKTERWFQVTLITFFLLSINSNYFYRIVVIHMIVLAATKIEIDFVKVIKRNIKFGLIFLLIAFLLQFENTVNKSDTAWAWSKKYTLPKDAVAHIKNNHIQGNMFNNYNWGGYLIWQLPEYKTYIDGRMSAWTEDNGELFIETYKKIKSAPYKNTALIDNTIKEYGITWLIDTKDSKLATYLIKERGWKIEYSNDTEIVIRMIL